MSDLRYWVGFNLVPRIGPVRVAALLSHFGDLEVAWRADPAVLRASGLAKDALDQLLYHRARLDLDEELDRVRAHGYQVLTWESEGYPRRLRDIDASPPVLYVDGDLVPNDEWAIAVVGTRGPSSYGKEMTRRLAGALAEGGITVVSGLALGVDGIAHRAALDAGGRTVAVLGSGIDVIYPGRHRALAEAVVRSGAVVSDYPLGTKPDGGNFPARNRIISGLALGTLVTEAGERSGSLITLRYALEQGRECFAVPGNALARTSWGTNGAIQRGEAKLATCVQDILEELNLNMVVQQRQVREIIPETEDERLLLRCLGAEPVHIDEVVRRSGLPTASVSSTLCMMELKGMVQRVDNASYILAH